MCQVGSSGAQSVMRSEPSPRGLDLVNTKVSFEAITLAYHCSLQSVGMHSIKKMAGNREEPLMMAP
eukprot:1132914-Pelagomonas_calceolata.AAC.2